MDDKTKNALLTAGSIVCGLLGLATAGLAAAGVPSAPKRNPTRGPSWRDFIRGEWWLLDGEELYADQDIGDQGHESIAIDCMFDRDQLAEALREILEPRAESDDEQTASDAADYLEKLDSAEGASSIYFEQKWDDVDSVAVGAINTHSVISGATQEEIWDDMERDIRAAFSKHYGAVYAHNRDFAAWKVDDAILERIRDFILGQAAEQGEGEPDDPDTEISIEESSTHRTAYIPVARFLTIRHPRDLWDPNVETQELWDSVTHDRDEQKKS